MGFFGNDRCCENRCHNRCCEDREWDCRKEKDCYEEKDCHKEKHEEKRCCRPCCCMNCTIKRRPCHRPKQDYCNSYPETIHDERDDEFMICCW